VFSCCNLITNYEFIHHLCCFQPCFIFIARNFHSRHTWYKKLVPKTGTRKWSQFMALVSGRCVMDVSFITKLCHVWRPCSHSARFSCSLCLTNCRLSLFQSYKHNLRYLRPTASSVFNLDET